MTKTKNEKTSFLLLMTPGMSLKKWNDLGQLSREIGYYKELCDKADKDLVIYSYGRNDEPFLYDFPRAIVLNMFSWIPVHIPFRLQNFLYNIFSLIIYRNYFKKCLLSKTNQFSSARFGLIIKFFYRIPLVIRMGFYYSHFNKLSIIQKFEERMSFRYSDLILTTSSEAKQYIMRQYDIAEHKILTICNSINLKKFRPLETEKEFDLIFLGRLEKSKNVKLIIDVVNSAKLKTLIIGKGRMSSLLINAIEKNPLINWRERVDNNDLPYFFNKSKCYVVLSEYEGNPKALLEAMACGIAVVGTNVPGTRECIENNVSGILIDKNVDKIVDAVKVICSDTKKAKFLGKNALKWITEQGDSEKNIKKEVQFYLTINKKF